MTTNLISLSGRMGSGKDLAAKIIKRLDMINLIENNQIGIVSPPSLESLLKNNHFVCSHWKVRKFGGALKQIASILTGIPVHKFEDQEFKKTNLDVEWNDFLNRPMTVRQFLQNLGTEAIRDNLHEDTWVNALFNSIEPEEKTIITDCRFPNELESVKRHAGITINIKRGGKSFIEHISETSLDDSTFMYEIDNNGSVEDLENKLKDILLNEQMF